MASDPYVRQARGVFTGTVGSTAIPAGAPVYFDGTDWELADADDSTMFAEAIAINRYEIGDTGAFCRSCIIKDIDASTYTQGDQYYLSAIVGTITNTRPSAAGNLVQVLGFGLSTLELYIDIAPVREETLWVDLPYFTGGSTAVTVDGDWAGLTFLANSDRSHGTQMFPENCVGLEIAYCWIYIEDALASGGITVDVSAGRNDETGTNVEDGITDTALLVTTADDLVRVDITAGFNGAGLVEPGNHFGVAIAKASDTGGDEFRTHGIAVVILVV